MAFTLDPLVTKIRNFYQYTDQVTRSLYDTERESLESEPGVWNQR